MCVCVCVCVCVCLCLCPFLWSRAAYLSTTVASPLRCLQVTHTQNAQIEFEYVSHRPASLLLFPILVTSTTVHPTVYLDAWDLVTLTPPFSFVTNQFTKCCWFYFLIIFCTYPYIPLLIAKPLVKDFHILCPCFCCSHYFVSQYLLLPPNCNHCLPRT